MNKFSLGKTIAILFFFFIFISSLYFAKDFLIPFAFGGILAIMLLPFAKWLEHQSLGRALSSLLSVVLFLLATSVFVMIISWNVSGLMEDISRLQQNSLNLLAEIRFQVGKSFGLPEEDRQAILNQNQINSALYTERLVATTMSTIMNVLLNLVLVIIYLFLFLFFRIHIKSFILKLVPVMKQVKTERMINNASKMAQNYLTGTVWMLTLLWIMYTIGFSIAGVKYALFFAVLCSMLELVPFIGSIIGIAVTTLLTMAQGMNSWVLIGIAITFLIIQLIYTYVLSPLIVNRQVNVNPMITILVLVAGYLIWGIPGLILAVPILGVAKVFCDNLEPLQPYGFLIGGEQRIRKDNALVRKISQVFHRKPKSEVSSTFN